MQPLNESFSFLLKNLLDDIFLPSNKSLEAKRKVELAEIEFYKYYMIDFDGEKSLRYALMNIKEYDIFDIKEMKKFLRLDIAYLNTIPDFKQEISSEKAYAIFYHMLGSKSLQDYRYYYNFPYILDQRNIIYFLFDNKEIKSIYTLGSKNIHDFTQPTVFIKIDINGYIDKSIFNKV